MDRTLSGRDAGMRFCIAARAAGRGLDLLGMIWDVPKVWRERMRQSRQLAALTVRDLAALGIPVGLAAYEAGRWPWQGISADWRALVTARRAAASEGFPLRRSGAPRPLGAPLVPFPAPPRRV